MSVPNVPGMVPPYESTALLALMAVLVAEHGTGRLGGRRLGLAVDVLVAAVGAATYVPGVELSATAAGLWLVAAIVAGDQVARLGGVPPQRDLLGLLGHTRTARTYAVTSLVSAATWVVGLVLVGRLAACVVLS